ncbi:hypothetical protein F4860DRAFT_412819 [Xylaria cubensis]|nr:hypothetical protein F4860DRAFT_412819 [Xylaria cubensis]
MEGNVTWIHSLSFIATRYLPTRRRCWMRFHVTERIRTDMGGHVHLGIAVYALYIPAWYFTTLETSDDAKGFIFFLCYDISIRCIFPGSETKINDTYIQSSPTRGTMIRCNQIAAPDQMLGYCCNADGELIGVARL